MSFDFGRTQRRIANMSERQMLDWLAAAIPGMQRHLEAYERTRSIDHLGELAIAETTANMVITELMSRKFGEPVGSVTEPLVVPSAQSEPKTDTGTTSAPRRFPRRRFPIGRAPVSGEDT